MKILQHLLQAHLLQLKGWTERGMTHVAKGIREIGTQIKRDNDSARQRQRQDDSGKTSVAIVAQASESE